MSQGVQAPVSEHLLLGESPVNSEPRPLRNHCFGKLCRCFMGRVREANLAYTGEDYSKISASNPVLGLAQDDSTNTSSSKTVEIAPHDFGSAAFARHNMLEQVPEYEAYGRLVRPTEAKMTADVTEQMKSLSSTLNRFAVYVPNVRELDTRLREGEHKRSLFNDPVTPVNQAAHTQSRSMTASGETTVCGLRAECAADSSNYGFDEVEGDAEAEPTEDYVVGGYHRVMIGDIYDNRYRVVKKLGWGVYSTVWQCVDVSRKREIALKVQKSAPEYTNAALNEIEILGRIRDQTIADEIQSHVVELEEHFYVQGYHGKHVCMVFELLGETLLHEIQEGGALEVAEVKLVTRCLLECLSFLHERIGVLHTDIKPENVLREGKVGPCRTYGRIKLVDLGTAFYIHNQTVRDIQTREYRCPEGILGAWPFEPAADIWSVGCLVFELLTGETLFDPQSPSPGEAFTKDESHLAQAIELLGDVPLDLINRGRHAQHWFLHDTSSLRNIAVTAPCNHMNGLATVLRDNFNFENKDAQEISTFLQYLLEYDPKKRASASSALSLPWLQHTLL
mmetsp:Transcript_23026/g.74079  ORF Transcript_23026/g.74079 Transcript_23026/m.74079 type:complete len:563 (-) Transcript_23026:340-2028(-)